MILCTMPACQTTAGCQCDRKAYQASLDKINRATDREIDDAVRRVNYGGGTVSDIVERLRRRAEEMDALSDPKQDIRSMSWQVEAHAALAKAAKDNLASADRIEQLERENAELREALKPFADEANCYDPDTGDGDDSLWGTPAYFKIRDLRRARDLDRRLAQGGA